GVNANFQQIGVGAIMVLAVGLDILRRRIFIAGGSSGSAETVELAPPEAAAKQSLQAPVRRPKKGETSKTQKETDLAGQQALPSSRSLRQAASATLTIRSFYGCSPC